MAFLDVLGGVGESLSETSRDKRQEEAFLKRLMEQSDLQDRNDERSFNRARKLQEKDEDDALRFSSAKSIAELTKKQRKAAGFEKMLAPFNSLEQGQLRAFAVVTDSKTREENREERETLEKGIDAARGTLGDAAPERVISTRKRKPLRVLRREASALSGQVAGQVQTELEAEQLRMNKATEAATKRADVAERAEASSTQARLGPRIPSTTEVANTSIRRLDQVLGQIPKDAQGIFALEAAMRAQGVPEDQVEQAAQEHLRELVKQRDELSLEVIENQRKQSNAARGLQGATVDSPDDESFGDSDLVRRLLDRILLLPPDLARSEADRIAARILDPIEREQFLLDFQSQLP